jgi:hypothetical protein
MAVMIHIITVTGAISRNIVPGVRCYGVSGISNLNC